MKNSLDTPAQYLKGIGLKRAKLFKSLGINSIEDFLYYFPRRYEDRTKFSPISSLKENEAQTIKAEVLAKGARQSFRRRGFAIVEIAVADATGRISCVWFNQPYLKDYFNVGANLILYGKVQRYSGKLQMNNPEFEIIDEAPGSGAPGTGESLNTGRIVPVYSLPEGVTQRYFRRLIKQVLDGYVSQVSDCLPYDIRAHNNLSNLARSLLNIHFPENPTLQQEAFRRLSFEEFFLFQAPLALRKLRRKEKQGIAHKIDEAAAADFISRLPFKLTAAQEKAVSEIKADLLKEQPMQRLLEGDVGSGKTVVATIAAAMVIQGGHQAAFMVPTEILAKQHYEKIGQQSRGIKIALLISGASKKEKEKIYREIKEGKIDLVVGTHALLEEKVDFKKLGLVIIDEQHKFGVGQRQLLPQKGINPDVLIMTATPIPRTLAITVYGDLDLSVITELPAGRLAIKTLHFRAQDRAQAYALARDELRRKHQAYIIYPVIEESFALDIAGAKKMYEELRKKEFKGFRLGLVHGRLKEEEQDEAMAKFRDKELDILVATTVLEVGIDIPNATCMIVEHAERFGLAQLHQLRGRVGRGSAQSFCLLVSEAQTEQAKQRLEAMIQYSDGFRIAEEDLRIRGPGEFFGARQHGLSELKIGNPLTQMQLLKRAREEAIRVVRSDPQLSARANLLLKEKLLQRFPEYEKLMLVG